MIGLVITDFKNNEDFKQLYIEKWHKETRIVSAAEDHRHEIASKYELYKNKQLPWYEVLKEIIDLYIIINFAMTKSGFSDDFKLDDLKPQLKEMLEERDPYFVTIHAINAIRSMEVENFKMLANIYVARIIKNCLQYGKTAYAEVTAAEITIESRLARFVEKM